MPHLSLLGMEAALLQEWHDSLDQPSQSRASYRLMKKTTKKRTESALEKVSWKNAWDEYVRGKVVSDTAAKLIQRFLLNTMASSGKAADVEQSEADASGDESELLPLKLSARNFRNCSNRRRKLTASARSGSLLRAAR